MFGDSVVCMEKKIEEKILKAIEKKVFPGCVVGIVYKTGRRIILPFGNFTYDNNSAKIQKDSIFDVASITKSIPTSSLALMLIGQGKLKLEDKVISFIPEFKDKENVLIKHLLTQTLDLKSNNSPLKLSSLKNKTPDKILNTIFNSEVSSVKKYNYNNTTSILLGLVIERITKSDMAKLADKYFFKPLNMKNTTFRPLEKFGKEQIVPTEIDNWRKRTIQGEAHDESAYVLQRKMTPGSAGLFSTVPDLLIFLEMILNHGKLNHKKYFSEEIIKKMILGFGWEINQSQYMGKFSSDKTIGKTGFTGCVVVCDMEKNKAIVLLSNHVYPKRKKNSLIINKIRNEIADIVFKN